MLLPFIAFWVLIIWGLKDGDLYIERVWPLFVVWLLALIAMIVFQGWGLIGVAVVVVIDIVLLFMVLGGDTPAF